jgi:hypothetical protein
MANDQGGRDVTSIHEHPTELSALHDRTDRLAGRVNELESRLSSASGAARRRVEPFLAALEHGVSAARTAIGAIGSDAGSSVGTVVDRARDELDWLEYEINAASEQLREELATTQHDLHAAARSELGQWRVMLDHLPVQADLARMELRDEIQKLRVRAEHAYREAAGQIDALTSTGSDTVETLRTGVRRLIDDVRSTVEELRAHHATAA